MSLLWERLINEASRAMESRCNNVRAKCGLDMCTGQEDCSLEPCLRWCDLKPFKNSTINEADTKYHEVATGAAK